MSEMYAPAATPEWKLIDSPVRPSCVPEDGPVEVLTTEVGVRFVRTPEERFAKLPGYAFAPHYAMVEGLRMHYVDEGPANGEVVLLLHGQPTWSYLYRNMVPVLAAAGYRAIAVDHLGMGRSDKPVDLDFHTFEKHVQRLKIFIEQLSLKDITLFCQDWGSLIGLRVAGDMPDLFARIVVANGTLPIIPKGMNPFRVPNPVEIDCSLGDFARIIEQESGTWQSFFQRWIVYALTAPNFIPSQVVEFMATHPLTAEEKAAYNAPFPSIIYKAAIRTFPSMVAAIEDQNVPAWQALGEYKKPFLFFGGEKDQNMGKMENQLRMTGHVPGALGQAHERFDDAGHFIQEDIGPVLAARVVAFMKANPLPHSGGSSSNMHGARYGEVLLVKGHVNHIEATVYNTLGLNDCPDEVWKQLDEDQIKKEHKARAVILNGPRYFLMDSVSGANVSDQITSFGGLRMRSMATVPLTMTQLLGGVRKPYTENIVNRSTTYTYNKGREVYELVAPDGTAYIMQSYALIKDPTLTEESLKTLGSRLKLPAGWSYRVRQLEQAETFAVHGKAHLIQDEFENSYQRENEQNEK